MNKKLFYGILVIAVLTIAGTGLLVLNRPSTTPTPTQEVTITTDKLEYKQGEPIRITARNGLDRSIWYEDYTIINSSFWGIEKFETDKWEPLIKFGEVRIEKFDFPARGERYKGLSKEGLCCAEPGGGSCYGVFDALPYVAEELRPNSEISYKWDQKICPWEKVRKVGLNAGGVREVYFEPEFIEKGHYRIVFEYGLSTEEIPGSHITGGPEFAGGTLVTDKETIYSNGFTIK